MQSDIQVSVVCVTYNHEEYIREALDSILMQKTTFSFEILVGEDCSTDRTGEILREYELKYPNRFTVLYRDRNLGATINEYELLQLTKGKYIASLELDDIWTDPMKLQKQYDFMESHVAYIGCAHDFKLIDKKGNELVDLDNSEIKPYLGKEFTLNDFLREGFVFQTGCHFYRNIWHDGGDYTVIYKADKLIRDKTILSILLQRAPFYILNDSMSAYRRFFDLEAKNGRNLTNSNMPQDLFDKCHHLEVLNEYFDGKIDYSRQWCVYVYDYLKGAFLHHNEGYHFHKFIYLYHHANVKVRKMVRGEFKETILNGITKALKK